MGEIQLRVARATNQIQKISEMYGAGLGLKVLAKFEDHEGYDGVMLGLPGSSYHFEFTQEKGYLAPRAPSEETLVVFYLPEAKEWKESCERMLRAGFHLVPSKNPYWDKVGQTFEDPEGYRVVLSQQNWAA